MYKIDSIYHIALSTVLNTNSMLGMPVLKGLILFWSGGKNNLLNLVFVCNITLSKQIKPFHLYELGLHSKIALPGKP